MPIGSSHSALYRPRYARDRGSSRTDRAAARRSRAPPPRTGAAVSLGLPRGSPTCAEVTHDQDRRMPASWNCRSLWSTGPSECDDRRGRIQSSFTRSGRPRLSLRSSSLAGTTSAEPASRFGRSSGPMARRLAVGRFHPWQDGEAMAPCSRTLLVGVFVFARSIRVRPPLSPRGARARTPSRRPPSSTRPTGADHSLHAGENRVVVRSRKIPDVVRDAVIAIEDQRYDHSGLDVRALLRPLQRRHHWRGRRGRLDDHPAAREEALRR